MISNNRITHIDKNGDTSTQTVNNPTYDIFGNVIADNRPGTAADMTYTYDTLHGWLTGISSPSGFSEQLQLITGSVPLITYQDVTLVISGDGSSDHFPEAMF